MNIELERQDIIQQLMTLEDANLLAEIGQLLQYHKHDFADMIGQEEKASVLRGIAEAEAGKGLRHEEMANKHKKWLGK